MTVSSRTLLCLSLLMAALSCRDCRDPNIAGVTGALRFEPTELRFDAVYADGVARTRDVTLINEGRATVDVKWTSLAAPFASELPTRLVPGANTVTIQFTPTAPGRFSQRLGVQFDDGSGSNREELNEQGATLDIAAVVRETPTCTASSACLTARFDLLRETCVEDPVEDGTTCDSDSLCLVNPRCEAGRCVGTARTCEDNNKCTIDVCYPLTGCEFLPAPPCPGDGLCMGGTCDPQTGCNMTPREDGALCGTTGESESCTEVKVCIEGACVVRDPPDGYVCAEASPCSVEGRCVGDVCVKATPPTTLQPRWSYDARFDFDPDAGTFYPPGLHDFVLEPGGEMSLSGFFGAPSNLRANTPAAKPTPMGTSRRCILWGNRYVCADYPSFPNGQVSGIDLATGDTLWTFNMRTARPDFLAIAPVMFLARLVVQGSDRLAAVFEGYPTDDNQGTQCRRYFIAVIDAQGNLVQAQHITDPLLDQCNHPHPYGVAADALGNLFVAFSPTLSPQAPLVPDDTTLIMSWSRDGVFRWKRTNTGMRGGELAVARGLLYAEYTSSVVEATSGIPVFSIPTELGRAVTSNSRLIPAPMEFGTTLSGYEAGQSTLRWTRQLPDQWTFWSDQLRLARWQTSKGQRTIALTWLQRGSLVAPEFALYGVDVQDGSEAFVCKTYLPVIRTPPQLFEVANGSLGVMNGAMDFDDASPACNKCDPPLAGSSGSFFSISTPTLSVADEPWVGTFGGAGHDHREN
ncbi:MAG: tenascin-X [Archangium gephyra]|uniref:Tenascin-X n=1 Tax=Archangium gephyra TaxID=48 RepID=A0A2W5UM40_9BACT|nr:MAG: tenascin-X [Archangium gephyra]